MIRAGKIDIAILGALQAAANGDLANWAVPGALVKGMGGAMDIVAGARRNVVNTDHVAKDGSGNMVDRCTLPLTGLQVVDRMITDRAVMDVLPDGLVLVYLAPGEIYDSVVGVTRAPVQDRE